MTLPHPASRWVGMVTLEAQSNRVSSCELGQDRPNRGPRSGFAFDHQSAPVAVHDVLDDREPEPRPSLLTARRRVHTVEALGQARQRLRRNAGAVSAHREFYGGLAALRSLQTLQLNLNLAPALTILDGILDDVLGHTHEFILIAQNPERLLGSGQGHLKAALPGQRLQGAEIGRAS